MNQEELRKEEWKDVIGYEGVFQISNYGEVRTFIKKGSCNIFVEKPYIRKPYIHRLGYKVLTLKHNKIGKTFSIHRLVAIHFIDNPNNLPMVNHIDGVKLNNYAGNLEWCNGSHNQKHRFTHLNQVICNRKLTDEQAKEIREKVRYKTFLQLSEEYKVSVAAINNIISGKHYKPTPPKTSK